MTPELINIRRAILEKRYTEAITIVDQLERMNNKAILRQIKSFVKILLIHLIKNQIEERLTNTWVAVIRNAILEIQDINLHDNKTSYYINHNEWYEYIDNYIDISIRDASVEVLNGVYNEFQIAQMVDKYQIIELAIKLLGLTYSYSARELPIVMAEIFTELPGGEDWRLGKR
jgi:hypothetical protein